MGAHRAVGQACGVAEWSRDELGWAGGRKRPERSPHLLERRPGGCRGKAGGKLGVVLALSRPGRA